MSQEQDLRAVLARKEAEAAELKSQLEKAASLGHELISQNQTLKTQLESQGQFAPDSEHPDVMLVSNGSNSPQNGMRQRLSVPIRRQQSTRSEASTGRVHFEDENSEEDGSVKGSRHHSPRTRGPAKSASSVGQTRSRLGTWEDWMAEKSNLEDEHALLRRKYTQLETELFDQQRQVRDRANSMRSSGMRSRGNSSVAVMPPAKVIIRDAEEEDEEKKEQERRELEQRIQKQVQSQYQEHIDELTAKVNESEAHVSSLDAELKKKSQELSEENEKYTELLDEMSHRNMKAENTIKQHEKQKELDAMRKSAVLMTDSIHGLSRRSSLVSNAHTVMTHARSIFEEVDDGRNLDHLEQENEELLQAVLDLRSQLDGAQTQLDLMEQAGEHRAKVPVQQGGGDEAAGGQPTGNLTAAQRADAEALITRLERVRNGIEDGNIKLQRQRRLSGSNPVRPAGLEDATPTPSYWESGKIFALSCLCCHTNRRKVPDLPWALPPGSAPVVF